MKGTVGGGSDEGSLGNRGIESGRFGFTVADVGRGGNESRSGVSPGTSRATTFCIRFAF